MASGQQAAKESSALPHSASSLALPSFASAARCCWFYNSCKCRRLTFEHRRKNGMFLFAEKVTTLKRENLRKLVCRLTANEEEIEDSQHRGLIQSIAFQQKTIDNTQEDMKGSSRVGPAWLLQISKDNIIIMSLSGQSYRRLEWCVWWEVALSFCQFGTHSTCPNLWRNAR